MIKQDVSVSKLADFASDPEGFEVRRGSVRSIQAARAGTRHHDQLGRSSTLFGVLLTALLVVLLLVSLWALL